MKLNGIFKQGCQNINVMKPQWILCLLEHFCRHIWLFYNCQQLQHQHKPILRLNHLIERRFSCNLLWPLWSKFHGNFQRDVKAWGSEKIIVEKICSILTAGILLWCCRRGGNHYIFNRLELQAQQIERIVLRIAPGSISIRIDANQGPFGRSQNEI